MALFLAVAACLLLAGVGRLREGEQCARCMNNLRQIGIGLQSNYDAYGSFLPAVVPAERLPPEKRLSWQYDVVGFTLGLMDRSWGQNRLKPWDDESNSLAWHLQPPWSFCPAIPNPRDLPPPMPTSYVGVAGIGEDAASLPGKHPRIGLFGYERVTRREDVTDGLETTLAVIETAHDNGPWLAGGPATVRGLDPSRPYLGQGNQFGGTHRRLTAALFADGSVHLLADSLHPRTFEALATIAGDEPATPFND